jgi:hypothetical protein
MVNGSRGTEVAVCSCELAAGGVHAAARSPLSVNSHEVSSSGDRADDQPRYATMSAAAVTSFGSWATNWFAVNQWRWDAGYLPPPFEQESARRPEGRRRAVASEELDRHYQLGGTKSP